MPAIAGVAALDVVVVALVALILAVALFPLFRPLISGALADIPVVGTWLSDNVDLLLFRGYVSALTWIGQAISPWSDLVRRVRVALTLWTETTTQFAEQTYAHVWLLRYFTIPESARQVEQLALGWVRDAERYALALAEQGAAYARELFRGAAAYALGLFTAAIAYVQASTATTIAYVQASTASALRYARDLSAADVAYTQAAVAGAENYARALFTESISYTQVAVLGAERLAERIGADAEGYARALERVAVQHADQVGAAVGAAAAAQAARVASRVASIEDSPCQQFCGPLGELGALLGGLEAAGLTAILLGMISEARSDPAALERTIREEVAPVVIGAARSLQLGLPD